MKKVEHMLIIVCALLIASLALHYGWPRLADVLVDADWLNRNAARHITSLMTGVMKLMVPVAIAIWMHREAKRDGAAPWVWVLLALVYQFLAPLLYYALKVHQAMIADRNTETAAS